MQNFENLKLLTEEINQKEERIKKLDQDNKKMEKNSYSCFLQRLNCCKFISLLSEFTFNYDYDLI